MPRRKEHPEIKQEFTCPNSACGLVFSKPLKVRNLCVENLEIYDACPRCLTAITVEEGPPMVEAKLDASATASENVENMPTVEKKKVESRPGTHCSHRFGYLSERPRNDKIPDECVVCENIVKCMLKSITGETG
jgi:hypothetical protein